MISLTLSVYLSVCLSVYLSTFISICPYLFSNSSPTKLRYEHFCRQISPFVSLPFFPSRSFSFLFLSVFLSCYISPSLPLFLSLSLFPFSLFLSPFCVETVTLLEPKRWSFYSSQCSSRFNFYATVVLSLIKIPTKKGKQDTEKKQHIYPDTLFPSQ